MKYLTYIMHFNQPHQDPLSNRTPVLLTLTGTLRLVDFKQKLFFVCPLNPAVHLIHTAALIKFQLKIHVEKNSFDAFSIYLWHFSDNG